MISICGNHILKRTKAQVGIHLPPLQQSQTTVEWTNQKEKEFAEDMHASLAFCTTLPNINGHSELAKFGDLQRGTLPKMVRARQSCTYPKLMEPHIKELMSMGIIKNDQRLLEAVNNSSKIDSVIDKLIERNNNNRRKIVFAHFRGEIDIIAERLTRAGISTAIIDGRTPAAQRQEILQNTKNLPNILLLQIQTGCEGLNLQAFNEVYFTSPHWNPAVEDQAIARCHRIGQNNQVDVFRFGMEGFGDTQELKDKSSSIDTYVQDKQEQKRKIMYGL